MAGEIIGVLTRVGVIAVALFVIAPSIATVKIIDNNEFLVNVRDHNAFGLSAEGKDLQDLINLTQTTVYWAFVLCGITVFAEVFSIILLFVNKQPTDKLIIGSIETILMCLGILCFLSLEIACAAHASSWGGPPDACERANELTRKDFCDSVPLTATNALQAVFSVVEIVLLGAVLVVTLFFCLRSNNTCHHHHLCNDFSRKIIRDHE